MEAKELAPYYDDGAKRDPLAEYLKTDEGATEMEALDDHWGEVMELAERYGFIINAAGGTATLATHGALIDALGEQEEARRLRMCNIDITGYRAD